MYQLSSTEAQNTFGKVLQKINEENVSITRNGSVVAVIMSPQAYERLMQLDDYYWGMKAREAEKEGFLGPEETMRFLNKAVHADT